MAESRIMSLQPTRSLLKSISFEDLPQRIKLLLLESDIPGIKEALEGGDDARRKKAAEEIIRRYLVDEVA